MNVFKRFNFVKLPPAVLCALLSSVTFASDFIASSQTIERYRTELETLEQEVGYFSYALIEPMQQLIDAQLNVNRLDAAEEIIDRAAQITRIEDGLYTALQYPFLKQAIEIEMTRGDWEEVNEKVSHYTLLIGKHYEGDATDRLQQMRWIAAVHLRGVDEDDRENEARHLISFTTMNETAVQYAQLNRLANDSYYAELLLDLALAYGLEAQGIRDGGRTSFRLRRLVAGLDLVEDKKEAIYKRYVVGLEKLEMYRELVLALYPQDLAIDAESNLLIADWHADFGKRKLAREITEEAELLLSAFEYSTDGAPLFTNDGESVSAD